VCAIISWGAHESFIHSIFVLRNGCETWRRTLHSQPSPHRPPSLQVPRPSSPVVNQLAGASSGAGRKRTTRAALMSNLLLLPPSRCTWTSPVGPLRRCPCLCLLRRLMGTTLPQVQPSSPRRGVAVVVPKPWTAMVLWGPPMLDC
jgi:hypothetical protein